MKSVLLIFSGWLLLLAAAAAQTAEPPTMSPGGEAPDPFGMKILTKDRPKNAKTEITADRQATFDNATSIAEFEGRVIVRDPQFTLFCDRLKVTLSKDRKGLHLAEAFGNVSIVQDNTDEAGKVVKSIGRAGKAVFEPASGNVTLTLWPQVQHGINNQVATEEGTVMVLNRDGRSRTTGGSKTVIVDNDGSMQ
jgi:lipopolysaccharide transport protein LptA